MLKYPYGALSLLSFFHILGFASSISYLGVFLITRSSPLCFLTPPLFTP